MLTCFATAVLYANRTPATMPLVLRSLHASAGELRAEGSAAPPATPLERLARTQALFLYAVVCLFDGDVGLRARAERDLPVLEGWLGELCRVRDNLGEMSRLGATEMIAEPPVEWEVC